MSDLIDRRAAIKAIEDLQDCYNGFSDTYDKACIIGVLEEVPSAQPERRFDERCTDCKEYDHERHCCPRFNHVIRTTLQEVQPERKKEKWIVLDKNNRWFTPHMYQCPFCRHTLDKMGVNAGRGDANYCPNCGARMEAEE